ncbi:hypothetical protein C8R44DRAFT_736935 [Mycena epipterygia]|nr:hypothetical protein C8R44DRAFT_736935 [Mycena epipterygia]
MASQSIIPSDQPSCRLITTPTSQWRKAVEWRLVEERAYVQWSGAGSVYETDLQNHQTMPMQDNGVAVDKYGEFWRRCGAILQCVGSTQRNGGIGGPDARRVTRSMVARCVDERECGVLDLPVAARAAACWARESRVEEGRSAAMGVLTHAGRPPPLSSGCGARTVREEEGTVRRSWGQEMTGASLEHGGGRGQAGACADAMLRAPKAGARTRDWRAGVRRSSAWARCARPGARDVGGGDREGDEGAARYGHPKQRVLRGDVRGVELACVVLLKRHLRGVRDETWLLQRISKEGASTGKG